MKKPWESKKSKALAEEVVKIGHKIAEMADLHIRLRNSLLSAILSGMDPKDEDLPDLFWRSRNLAGALPGRMGDSLEAVLRFRGGREVTIPAEDIPDHMGPSINDKSPPHIRSGWWRSRTIRNKRIERASKHIQPNAPD